MDLREFLSQLNDQQILARVDTTVSCDLELASRCRREFASSKGGSALLFSALEESEIKVAANLFGSEQRLLMMLRSSSLQQLAEKLKRFLAAERIVAKNKQIVSLQRSMLNAAKNIGLNQLPAIRTWPSEGQRYFTLALTVTKDPETGAVNLGLYRAQRISDTEIALNFAPGSGAAKHLERARQKQEPLPVALVFGGDPALIWAAAAPLPENVDEFDFCRQVFASDNTYISCLTQDLRVPANAELVIEGEIDPLDNCIEGPFGNHTGQYVTRKDCPRLRVTGMLTKPDPVLPMTVVGPPPSENVLLGIANEVYIREWLKMNYPDIHDIKMPQETIFHGAGLLSVSQPGQKRVRELIDQLWTAGPLKKAKILIFLDTDIDLKSFSQCWWRVVNMLSAERVYQENKRLAIDVTGIDMTKLIIT